MRELLRGLVLAGLCCSAVVAHASSFYVDANTGSDTNPGTSAALAWASLAAVNQHTFAADDHILFHTGQSWVGVLEPHGSGTAEHPIVVGSYGDGAKPLIKGQGAPATVVLRNVSGWTVQDIAITDHGESQDIHLGILITTNNYAFALHVVRVEIRDVNGQVSKMGGGIGIVPDGQGKPAHFDDVLIDHCTIHHMAGDGIFLHVVDADNHRYLNTHVRLTDNTITDIGKNAIYLRATTDGVIDHNTVRLAGAREHGNAICVGWSMHTVVSHNEVSDTALHTGPFDGGAIDVDDGAVNTVVEYNWSHGNVGAVGVGSKPNDNDDATGTIVRYNLSENDHLRIFTVHGHDRSTAIYNNTAYIGPGQSPYAIHVGKYQQNPELPDGILFARNVFFNDGELNFQWKGSNLKIDGNCYFGNEPKDVIADKHIAKDSKVHLTGAPMQHRNDASVYGVPADSACGPLVPALPNASGTDFMGTPLSDATPGVRGAIASPARTMLSPAQ